MYKRVLVAVDGSAAASRAVDEAIELAGDQRALLIALHVIDELGFGTTASGGSTPDYVEAYVEALRVNGRRILDKVEKRSRKRRIACETVMTDTGGQSVAHAILAQARLLRADVIVLGTHGRRGLRRFLLGSDAESVLREAQLPVLVVRESEANAVTRPATSTRPVKRASVRIAPALHIESSQ